MGAFHIFKGLSFISPLVSYHFHLTSISAFLKIPAFSFLALVSSGFLILETLLKMMVLITHLYKD